MIDLPSDPRASLALDDAALWQRLDDGLLGMAPLAVALSGGVDSITLAVAAHRLLGAGRGDVLMVHATSPAVPDDATLRVRDWARREGWWLDVVDAGEFADPRYRANPVNRCFFCKTNLYAAIRERIGVGAGTHAAAGTGLGTGAGPGATRQIVSGANLDDLAEYRPGLEAAREHGVRHPYIEAAMNKAAVRRRAASLGLGDVAELPASPCLSSRVETGIAIEATSLRSIHAVETWVRARLAPGTVRCRVRAAGIVVELDAPALSALPPNEIERLAAAIRALWTAGEARPITFAPYRTGSAFLQADGAAASGAAPR